MGVKTEVKKWMGSTPKCDMCGAAKMTKFVDGKTKHGPWAIMCLPCYKNNGRGIGAGSGQLYGLQDDGSYVKELG